MSLLDSLELQYPTYCWAADRTRFSWNQWIQLEPGVHTLSTSRVQIIGDISKQWLTLKPAQVSYTAMEYYEKDWTL